MDWIQRHFQTTDKWVVGESMTKQWHGGKGSAPRKGSDNKKFAENWDAIFGKKDKDKKDETKTKDEKCK